MTVTITAFEKSPDGGKGLARDMRVRWALEEAGQPYEVRLLSFHAMKQPAHLALHPFGQGNPEPVFGVRGVVLRSPCDVFKEQHFRFSFDDPRGRRLHGVAWKLAHRLPPLHRPLDLAVELKWNHFNGRKLLQLGLIDWRLAG